jgi:hypothetical protein
MTGTHEPARETAGRGTAPRNGWGWARSRRYGLFCHAVVIALSLAGSALAMPDGPAPRNHSNARVSSGDRVIDTTVENAANSKLYLRSRRDSLDWGTAKRMAEQSAGYRVVISLMDRELKVVRDSDTVYTAQVAVGNRESIEFKGKRWTFNTPRGRRTVMAKDSNPVWIPPEWHYAEVALDNNLAAVRQMKSEEPIKLQDGRTLTVIDSVVGLLLDDSTFAVLPRDEEIVFFDTLYIPPVDTKNRRVEGMLGKFRLDMGQAYYLHGTPYLKSIGRAATHGCIRLKDEDIAWLYQNVPVGTSVYIF